MKINPKIAKTPEDLKKLEFKQLKGMVKKELKRLEKNTDPTKPTQVMLMGEYDFPDKKGLPLLLLGKWKGDFKLFAKTDVAKRPDGVIGSAYFGGLNPDGKKIIKIDVAKGKGKPPKLTKNLRKLVPQATFQVVFGETTEDALEALGNAPDVEEIEVDDSEVGSDTDEDVVDADGQDIAKLLLSNLQQLSATFVPIRDASLQKLPIDSEDVVDMNDLATEWLSLFNEADEATQAKFAEKKPQVLNIQAFANKLNGNAPAKTSANNPKTKTYTAAQKALEIGLEMAKQPKYQAGHCYIPFTGKSGKEYKPGDAIDPADGAPTWCNQFAYDMTKSTVGENTPFNFLPAGQGYTNANALLTFMEDANGVLFDKIGKFEEAWQHANAGKMVYFVYKAKIGHVSTAAPTKPEQMIEKNGDKYGMVIQAGARTGNMHIFKVWGDPVKAGVEIFLSRFNEPLAEGQQQDPNLSLKIYNTISTIVGKGHEVAANKGPQKDIKTVQLLLINAGQKLGTNGVFKNGVDGICKDGKAKTIAAIEAVQRQMVAEGIQTPINGFVAMGDATWNYLYSKSKTIIETPAPNPNEGQINTVPNNTTPTTPTGNKTISSTVQKGSKGADAKTVQELLIKAGLNLGDAGADGDAGTKTDAAIRAFQKSKGLPETGIVAPNDATWKALNGEAPTNTNPNPQPNTSKTLSGTVGTKGANAPADVALLKTLLNQHGASLDVSNPSVAAKTVEAIKNFQKSKGLPETGLVAPNDATWKALNGQATTDTSATIKPEQVQFQYAGGAKPMSAKAEQVLREILAKANEPKAMITSTIRTAEEQATVMYNNIIRDGAKNNRKAYKNPALASQVVDAFETAQKAGKTDAQIKQAVLEAVNKVGAANLSGHCNATNPAIDIHPASLKNKGNFETILKADARVTAICPPKDPFYHIEVK